MPQTKEKILKYGPLTPSGCRDLDPETVSKYPARKTCGRRVV